MTQKIAVKLFLVWFIAFPVFADVVYLKNGKKVEGVIRDSGGEEILVETPGGVFSFNRDAITRIEESSELANLLSRAQVEEMRENFVQAIELYTKADRQAASSQQRASIRRRQENTIRKFVEYLNSHDPLKRGLQDIQEIEQIKMMISDPSQLALLQSAKMKLDNTIVEAHLREGERHEINKNYPEAIEHYRTVYENYTDHPLASGLQDKITELYVEWGEEQYKKGEERIPNAQEAFQEALARNPNQPRALYFLGLIAAANEEFKQAESYLSKADPSALTSYEKKHLDNMLARVQRELKPPEVRPVRRPVYVPPPQPTPEPSTTEKVTGWFTGLWTSAKDLFSDVTEGSSDIIPQVMEWLWILLYALGIILIVWYIPMKIVLRDLPNRKVIYYNWRKIINYTGIFGLIFYCIDRLSREKPRKRCPACNRAIDNPSLFENYDFSRCPFCEKIIKPPFTLLELVKSESELIAGEASRKENGYDEADKERVQELLNLILLHGRKARANEVWLEPEEEAFFARYRIDGVMAEEAPIEKSLQNFVISCIKASCDLNVAEKRLPQNGHFRKVVLGEEINIRVSTQPTTFGERVVLRLVDPRIASMSLDRLGMREETLMQYRKALSAHHGLILNIGPAGSGKTTFQYATIQFINDVSKDIVTVENPIEFELEDVNQLQHNPAMGMTFSSALESALVQEPDLLVVSDIRDPETADIIIRAASDNRLILSSLNAFDCYAAIGKLKTFNADAEQVSKALQCLVAQRLVRKLCPHCKKHGTPSAKEIKSLGEDGNMLEGQPVFRPRGCRECSNSGYLGRTGIFEVVVPTEEIQELIANNARASQIRKAARRAGMKNLREEGILKILAGLTSIEEIVRVTTPESREQEASVQ